MALAIPTISRPARRRLEVLHPRARAPLGRRAGARPDLASSLASQNALHADATGALAFGKALGDVGASRDQECFTRLLCCGGAAEGVCQGWKDENCGDYPNPDYPNCNPSRRALYSTVSPPLWSEARQPHSRSHTHLTTRPPLPAVGAGRRPVRVRRGAGRDLRRLARGDHLLRGGAARLPRRLELLGDALHRRLRPRPRQTPPLREDVRRVRHRERGPGGGVAAAAGEMRRTINAHQPEGATHRVGDSYPTAPATLGVCLGHSCQCARDSERLPVRSRRKVASRERSPQWTRESTCPPCCEPVAVPCQEQEN